MNMKKTYFSPVSRFVDLSMESGCCFNEGSSEVPIYDDDSGAGADEAITKRQSIWDNWKVDDN